MKALAVLATAGLLGIATQADATIYIGLDNGNGTITTAYQSDPSGSAAISGYSYGGFTTSVTSTGYPVLAQPALQSTSVNTRMNGTAGATGTSTLTIYVTQTDLQAFTGTLSSAFTANQFLDPATGSLLANGNASVIQSAYYSASNQLYGGTLFGSHTFDSAGTASATSGLLTLAGPFSETTKYVVSVNNATGGSLNDTINISGTSAVPEPATWAMMFVGFGFIGATLRQRRRAAVSFG